MAFNRKRAMQIGGRAARAGARTAGSVIMLILKILGTVLLIGATTCALLACMFALYINFFIAPDLDLSLSDYTMNQSSVIYYENKSTGDWEELVTLYDTENRIWVDYKDIPAYLRYAAVAIEDKRFHEHNGVDWYRTAGAFGNMFLGMRDTFGGSTITQQLIKNLTQEKEVTVTRKLQEIFTAIELERNYSKQEIMEWYLNTIYLGEGCSGVNTAANVYFGKELSDLTIAECASLIGITNNPSMYDPYIEPEANLERQQVILFQMYDQDYITKKQYEEAKKQKLVFKRGSTDVNDTVIYSYFEDLVIKDVIEALEKEKDVSEEIATRLVYNGGFKIYATIDVNLQSIVDGIYQDVAGLPETTGSKQQFQSGITLIDNSTGSVVAVCGGVGEKTGSREWSRATDTVRPPGSSIKPLSVYSPSIELGLITPVSVIDDAPLDDITDSKGNPWPKNDDGEYLGLTTVREGLRQSRNAVAAQLLTKLTPQASYDFLVNKYRITSLVLRKEAGGEIKSDIGYAPLALGQFTDGVSTREMAAAFETFANDGIYTQSRTFTKVVDSKENIVIDNEQPEKEAVINAKTAYYINDMLKAAVASGTGYEARLSDMIAAGKTGTTGDNCDRWFVGYTAYYTAAVWTGYDIPESIIMKKRGNPAAQIWKRVMEQVNAGHENKGFTPLSDPVPVTCCTKCGFLASSYTKESATYYLAREDVPTTYCTGVHISKIKPKILDTWVLDAATGQYRDTATGWYVDLETGLLIHPQTGELVDPGDVGKYIDKKTGWLVDQATGYLIYPETGELVDPEFVDEFLAAKEAEQEEEEGNGPEITESAPPGGEESAEPTDPGGAGGPPDGETGGGNDDGGHSSNGNGNSGTLGSPWERQRP